MEQIEEICRNYELKEIDFTGFQGWLCTVTFEDEFHWFREKIIQDALNSLEEILFMEPKADHYRLGVEVARQLVAEMKEFERMHKVRRYLDDNIK
jgi:hypothetical protein